MAVNVAGFRALYSRDPNTGEIFAISSIGPSGPPGPQGTPGPTGPLGPTGLMGVSTVIIGDFGTGSITTPAGLPPTGVLVADDTEPGSPAYTMEPGESLFYAPADTADPLYGDLYQYVTTGLEPSGWLSVGQIVGPPGPLGATGPSGATGPETDEVHFGPELPTGPAEAQVQMWLDTDDNRILGPAEMPLGGATGNVLRKVTGADGDVAWTGNIVMNNGEVIQFPNQADVPKIHLYSNTFGFGIESGTITIFGSSNVRLRLNGITGTQIANFASGSMTTNGWIQPGSYVIITGADNTTPNHYFVDSVNNDVNVYFKALEGRRLDAKTVFQIRGYQGALTGGQPENCHMKVYVNAGDDGIIETAQFHHSNATGLLHVHGNLTTSGTASLMSAGVRSDEVRPLDPERVGRLIDRLNPVTFRRTQDRAEGATRDPVLQRQAGFDARDLEDYREELVGPADGEDGVSIGGLLAAAMVELKSLRARVAQLEGGQ